MDIVNRVPQAWMTPAARSFGIALMRLQSGAIGRTDPVNACTLFLAWQDKTSRRWFPVGRLDADVEHPLYRYCYIGGAKRAQDEAHFVPLSEFPDLRGKYESPYLFPSFSNRVMARGRPDRDDYLRTLGLPADADAIEILKVSGGYRVTDAYEVFPKLAKRDDGRFTCRFFLHGWRHVSPAGQARIDSLKPGEKLYLTLELTNPVTTLAVQIQSTDYQMLGWAPNYLVYDLAAAAGSPREYEAQVVRVNPLSLPSRQRVLIEIRGRWDGHEPMTHSDFLPLTEDPPVQLAPSQRTARRVVVVE